MELLGVSILTPSGGSFRTTVPVSIPRDVWKKNTKHIPVCFVKEKNRILLIPFDDLINGDYPESLKKKAIDKFGKKIFGGSLTSVIDDLAKGKISTKQFWDEIEKKYTTIQERYGRYINVIKGSLAFADKLEWLILSATLAEDELRAERFQEIFEAISEVVVEKKKLMELLDALRDRKDIEEDVREFVESRLTFELERVNEELEKIRSIICKD